MAPLKFLVEWNESMCKKVLTFQTPGKEIQEKKFLFQAIPTEKLISMINGHSDVNAIPITSEILIYLNNEFSCMSACKLDQIDQIIY